MFITTKSKLADYLPLIFMFILFLAFTAGNFVWLKIDQGYGWDDTVHYFTRALVYQDTGSMDSYYPPLTCYIMALGNKICDRRDEIGSLCLQMPLFLLLFMAGMYLLGIKLGSRWIGVIAVLLTMSTPAVFHSSRLDLLEFPDTALLVLFISLIVYSNFYQNRVSAILSGCVAGFGMLTKQTFIFYSLFAVIFSITYGLSKVKYKKPLIINIVLMISCCGIVSGIWYGPKLITLLKIYFAVGYHVNPVSGFPPLYSLKSLLYFWFQTKDFYLNPFIIGVFFVSSIWTLFFLKEKRGIILTCLSVIVGTYISFSLIYDKNPKNVIPYIPFIFLIITTGIASIKIVFFRLGIISILIIAGFLQYFSVGFNVTVVPYLNALLKPILIKSGPSLWKPYAPAENDYILHALLDIMKEKKSTKVVRIGALGEDFLFTDLYTDLNYVAILYKLPLHELYCVNGADDIQQAKYDYLVVCNKSFQPMDYILIAKYNNGLRKYNKDDCMCLYKKPH